MCSARHSQCLWCLIRSVGRSHESKMLGSRWSAPARGRRMRHGRCLGKRGVTRNNQASLLPNRVARMLPVKDPRRWRCATALGLLGAESVNSTQGCVAKTSARPETTVLRLVWRDFVLRLLDARLARPSRRAHLLELDKLDLDYLDPPAALLMN